MSRRLVVEADGGSRGNPGPAGYGALVRDAATGEVLDEAAAAIGVATNNVAEYSGLLAGLRAAAAIDPEARVEVRMDSKLVVEQMTGRWQVKHEDMRRLARQAREVFGAGRVSYAWVPRRENGHADRLANEAMDAAAAGRTWSRGSAAAARPGEALVEPAPSAVPAPTYAGAVDGTQAPARAQLAYRLLTGTDDRAFCEKVSAALAEGYELHGSPAITHDGDRVVVAQAVLLPAAAGGSAR
ncbi:MAG: FIG006762: Phosphoglycerate mutase family [uncultured Quadrisphaera sp.]|uniref:FIG006762: Phosphoglycerate mutase family n=1 Tax=uncultured Quadrisphaera sp. TaxID=904978 RepID=A0A6J4QE35_9ACTN|nr:MAG: FIG006762: Phosphoglycerate mutase family [uncultured Quadrisphaera sp.]